MKYAVEPRKQLSTVPKQIHRGGFDKSSLKFESTTVDLFRKE
jgi:hypothetical protein